MEESVLIEALRRKYKTPAEVMKKLELDPQLLAMDADLLVRTGGGRDMRRARDNEGEGEHECPNCARMREWLERPNNREIYDRALRLGLVRDRRGYDEEEEELPPLKVGEPGGMGPNTSSNPGMDNRRWGSRGDGLGHHRMAGDAAPRRPHFYDRFPELRRLR